MDSGKENVKDDKPTEENPISDNTIDNDHSELHDELTIDVKLNKEINEGEPEKGAGEAPPPPPDLEKISQDFDGYISTLANLKSNESVPLDVPIFVEQYAVLLEAKIGEYDSNENHVKWTSISPEDSSLIVEAITRLSSLSNGLSDFSSEFKFAYTLNRIGGVLERAIAFMEEEFKILCDDFIIHDSDSNKSKGKHVSESEQAPGTVDLEKTNEEDNGFPGYSDETFSEIVRLSKAMIIGGHEIECTQSYYIARRNALDESMKKLGFEKCSIDEVQKMNWESLEREIVIWIRTFKRFVTVYLPMEKKLAGDLFSDHPSIGDKIFCSLSSGIMIQLLNFAEAVGMTKRAAEKLFKFLDIYEALRDVIPATENLLPRMVKL